MDCFPSVRNKTDTVTCPRGNLRVFGTCPMGFELAHTKMLIFMSVAIFWFVK